MQLHATGYIQSQAVAERARTSSHGLIRRHVHIVQDVGRWLIISLILTFPKPNYDGVAEHTERVSMGVS